MRYFACSFASGGRQYTYHYDGEEELVPGDKVEVNSRGGGVATVIVAREVPEAPRFTTAPILGLAMEPSGPDVGDGENMT